MRITLEVKSVMILTGKGADQVFMTVDKPYPCYPYDGELSIKFEVAAGQGYFYVSQNFEGIDPLKIRIVQI